MRIGAHVSSAGGVENIFERADAIEAEAIQTFISAPQQWRPPNISDEQVAAFREAHTAMPVPVFLHGIYLINLAADDTTKYNRSVGALKQYLKWGAVLGIVGTVFHVGSHKGRGFEDVEKQIVEAMEQVLAYESEGFLIMENNAGQGGGVGSTFAELGAIIRGLDGNERVKVCLDTCHAFAMGYDLRSDEAVAAVLEEFDQEIGLDRLVAVHANDSKGPLGGVRDRHENIGDGEIGTEGFRAIMANPAFHDLPFLLEVPGIEGDGPDIENIRRLKHIREQAGAPGP